MEKATAVKINNRGSINDQSIGRSIYRENLRKENYPVFEKLAAEGSESFFNYLDWLGLANDSDIIILPSTGHYFYDHEDVKEVRTVVNMKKLNQVKQIKDFLHNICHILEHQSYFIGLFYDNKYQNGFFSYPDLNQQIKGKIDPVENGIESRNPFLNMMYNIMDSKTNRYLSKSTVALLLEAAGFKVLNMTNRSGLTYFCAQKVGASA